MVISLPRSRATLGAPMSRKHWRARTEAAVDLFLRGCGYRAVSPAGREDISTRPD
jgi:hypothetical protein